MLEAKALHKAFGEVLAVQGVDLTVRPGEALGLLGPNGAGKSTTIHMLVGALSPDRGEVQLGDRGDVRDPQVRRAIGIAPQDLAIYDELSARENLAFFGRVYGLAGDHLAERVTWGLAFAGLTDRHRDRAGTFSGGMKRRLNLACAVVHAPKILICDEPTVGVDPQSRNHIFESIEALKAAGMTLLYTTHYMEEAERLCDRVAIMDRGKVLAIDRVEALIEAHGGMSELRVELSEPPGDDTALPGTLEGSVLRIDTEDPTASLATLAERGVTIAAFEMKRPNLERVFLGLTGRRLRD